MQKAECKQKSPSGSTNWALYDTLPPLESARHLLTTHSAFSTAQGLPSKLALLLSITDACKLGARLSLPSQVREEGENRLGCMWDSKKSLSLLSVYRPTPTAKMLVFMGTIMQLRLEEFTQVNELEMLSFDAKVNSESVHVHVLGWTFQRLKRSILLLLTFTSR